MATGQAQDELSEQPSERARGGRATEQRRGGQTRSGPAAEQTRSGPAAEQTRSGPAAEQTRSGPAVEQSRGGQADWAWPGVTPATTGKQPGLRKQQAAQTEAELKAAAIRVFDRVGYLNAKITDITAEAGRATGSFYKHFAGKEALLAALLADLLAEGDASAELPGHGTDFRDRDAVRFHVAAFWGFYRRHRVIMVALQQAALVDEAFAERSRDMLAPDLGHIADHLAGLDLPGDPLVSASLFGATVSSFAATWLTAATRPALGRELTDDEAIETLTTFLHRGFGA